MTRTFNGCLAAATVIGLAGVPVIATFAGDPPAGASNPTVEAQVLALVNADRTTRGLPALAVDPGLVNIARSWSDQMLASGTLSHNYNLPNELTPQVTAWGENVGMGGTAAAINTAWIDSPSHYANLVGNYNFVGVGVSTGSNGISWVTVDYELAPVAATSVSPSVATIASAAPAAPACRGSNPVSTPNPAAASGYVAMGPDGGIFTAGAAPYLGSLPGSHLAVDAVGLAMTPDQRGYWELGSDGGVFGFGTAAYHGSPPGLGTPTDAVGIAPTPSGAGYWVLGRDGGVFGFGDAAFHGSLPGVHVASQAVSIAPTRSGRGYWILGGDGGVFAFGDAVYAGSPAGLHISAQVASIAPTPSGAGYWVLDTSGGVYSFGDATFYGSLPGTGCTTAGGVSLVPTVTGHGYEVLGTGGAVFAFGDAPHFPQVVSGNLRALAVTH